jgi:hypothetical protein
MCAEAVASGSVAVIASRGGIVVQHRKCDELVPLGWLLRLHVLFISLFFCVRPWLYKLLYNSTAFFCFF